MTMSTDKHRETAQGIADEWFPTERGKGDLINRITAALANTEADAFTAGRDEAKAEDAEIAKSAAKEYESSSDRYSGFEAAAAETIHARILAPSSGPTYEQRLRAEVWSAARDLVAQSLNGDDAIAKINDVLAAIRSEK